jgi:hypothetical protein
LAISAFDLRLQSADVRRQQTGQGECCSFLRRERCALV